ncbi:MAG: type VI secretion system membrane subunit TssM [Hyphomicrobiales bacterium]
MKKWLVLAASIIGILALCALVWFVFPIVAFADIRPFESPWIRGAIIFFILGIFCAYHAIRIYRRHKAAQAIQTALTASEPGEPDSDAPVLGERMADAILTLKKSQKTRGDPLYELPWYVIIGPPGAGKTTALLNSGLKFPLAAGAGKASVAGIGGTRYCDWWFTEDAVLIDTAGRYTTQDSDVAADRKSWLSFLDLLKTNRAKQPINGVLVAISLEDLMTIGSAEVAAHATAIRKRLMELQERLQISFPVYALFTKADLVSGFMEYFGSFGEQRRRLVWGATFQTDDKTANKIGDVEPEFDLLLARLSEEVPDRLQEEADPLSRAKLFSFPSQMAALKPVIVDFLNQIFEPTRYHTNVALRGFYFTSGTQQGTPIDKVLGAMAGSFGTSGVAPAYSGRAKSFFLGDLLTKVIFGEAGWVSTNREAIRRARLVRFAGYSAVALACLAVLGLWWMSYLANTKLVADTQLDIEEYKRIAAPIIQQNPVADTNFEETLPLLHKLRYLPSGYGLADQPTPIVATFGLSQRERLLSAAKAAYRTALDRVFRSRLILNLEKEIENNRNDPVFVYEALKVYLMLGSDPNVPVDDDLIIAWMTQEWDNLYPGAANQKIREELLQHLHAMLELSDGPPTAIQLNGALVEEAQNILVRMSIADRAYALIKSAARSAPVEDWIASSRGGDDAKVVFEARDGSDLDTVRVPNLFTYNGFQELFLGKLETIADQLEKERWVLGKAGQQSAVERQYKTLGPDLLDIYAKDFVAAWQSALGKLKLKSLAGGKPTYPTLQAAAGPASPIKLISESIASETKLTEERTEEKKPAGKSGVEKAAGVLQKKLESKLTGLARIGLDLAKSQQRAGGGQNNAVPGANIEAQFKRFHQLVEGAEGQRPIDVLIQNLSAIYLSLTVAQGGESDSGSAKSEGLQQQVATLRVNASRLPDPLSNMMLRTADEFEGYATNTTIAELNQQLQGKVTRRCEEIVRNRYPFAQDNDREVPLIEFANLFSPNGIIDKFFNERLASLVDMSKGDWKWRGTSRLGRELSQTALRQFQNAALIRDAFFPSGGTVPSISFTVTAQTLSQKATGAEFEVNGEKLQSIHGIDTPKEFTWPGSSTNGTASVVVLPEVEGLSSAARFSGPWALYRLLNAGNMSEAGDKLSARYILGGREVSYLVKVGSLANPFALPALRNFACPAEL